MRILKRFSDFQIQLDLETVLRSVGCAPESPSRAKADRLFPLLEEAFFSSVQPCAWSVRLEEEFPQPLCICLLTLGNITDRQVSQPPAGKGSCLWSLLFDACLREYLFRMDSRFLEWLRPDLAGQGLYIRKRLEAPGDFDWNGQAWLLNTVNALENTGISLNGDYLFSPPRTMAYLLLLGSNSSGCSGEHDCSRCSAHCCSRRG